MQAMYAQLMNTLAMYSIIKLWACHVRRSSCRSAARSSNQFSFFTLQIFRYQRWRSVRIGSVKRSIDEVARYTNQHNCPDAAQEEEAPSTCNTTNLHRYANWNKVAVGAPVTLPMRRVRRKSSAKIDQSSNQSNRFNLRRKWNGSFFLIPRTCCLASRRVLSEESHWESRLLRINKFNILFADTNFIFSVFTELHTRKRWFAVASFCWFGVFLLSA